MDCSHVVYNAFDWIHHIRHDTSWWAFVEMVMSLQTTWKVGANCENFSCTLLCILLHETGHYGKFADMLCFVVY